MLIPHNNKTKYILENLRRIKFAGKTEATLKDEDFDLLIQQMCSSSLTEKLNREDYRDGFKWEGIFVKPLRRTYEILD